MKHFIKVLLFICVPFLNIAQNINPATINCGVSGSQSLTNSGFTGSNASSTTGSCGQCCYQNSDLDGDGDADVTFSVENTKWFRYCNPSSTATTTIDFVVDETNNDCNLQGSVYVTQGTSAAGSSDAYDIDCSNIEYQQFGSGVSGNSDGFSFTGITIPAGGCAWLQVDGYGGASCGAFTVNAVCPPLCTVPTSFTAGSDLTICSGSSILINSTVSGGTTTSPGLTYSWAPTTGLSCTTCADPTATPTSTITYTMTACNGGPGLCCVTDQVVVNVTPPFTANAGPDVTSCAPSTFTLGGSGGTPTGPAGSTYVWAVSGTNNSGISITSGANTANPTVTFVAGATGSETYQVTVTNGACVRTDIVTVTVGTLAVNAGADQDLCAGSSLAIGGLPTAAAGATYIWAETSGDNTAAGSGNVTLSLNTASNPVVTANTSAIGTIVYTVTATLSGCSNTDQVSVFIRPLPVTPTATASPATICAGQSVTLTASGGAGADTYSWWSASTGGTQLGVANTLVVTPTATTTYYVQSTDATYGCVSARGTVTVTVNSTPVANAGVDRTICSGSPIILSGNVTNPASCSPAQTWSVISGSGTFSPNANALNASFTPTASGSITLRLTPCPPSAGCSAINDDVVLTITPAPVVVASAASNPICLGLLNDLAGTVTGGTPIPPPLITQTFTSNAGPFTIPDNNLNGLSIPINVSGVSNSVVGLTDIQSVGVNIDHNSIGQLEVWLCPPGVTPSPTTTGSGGNAVTTYSGCIQLFNNSGGNGDDLINTVFTDAGTVDIASGTPPYSGTFNLSASNVLNGSSGFDDDPTNGTWNILVVDNSSAGNTPIGTASQMSITFTTPDPNALPYIYSWSPSTGLSANNDLYPTLSTTGLSAPSTVTYTLTATDANNCVGSSSVAINIIDLQPANAGSDQNVCISSAVLNGNTPATGTTGQWTVISGTGVFANATQYNSSVSGLSTGANVFQWTLTNSCGTSSDQVTITSNPPTTVGSASSNPSLCVNTPLTSNITFNATAATGIGSATGLPSGITASFSGNTISVSGTPNASGTYNYTIPITGGCGSVNATGTITVIPLNSVTAASSTPSLCLNAALSPSVTFNATGANGIGASSGLPAGVTASWFGNTLTLSGAPTASGTFNYSIPLTGGCGNVNATGTITVVVLPFISLTPDDPNTCNATDGSILVSGNGNGTITWSGPTSGNSSSSLNYTIPNLGAGTYSVYFTNASGCQSSTLQTSLANPGAPEINIINDVTNCGTSYSLPAVPVVPGTQNNPKYYTGPGGTGLVVPVDTTYNAPTNITLYAYDVNGACSDEEPFTITINEIPSVNSIPPVSVCPGEIINPIFSSTPAGATFSWTNNNIAVGIPSFGSGQIGSYNAPANSTNSNFVGTINVTPTLNGCSGSVVSFPITIYPTPTIETINNIAGCSSESLDPDNFVSVPNGATFEWSNSNSNIGLSSSGTDQIPTFNLTTNNTAGVISSTITAVATLNGCESLPLSYTISINPIPVITLNKTNPSVCNGTDGSIEIDAGSGSTGNVSWIVNGLTNNSPIFSNYVIPNLSAGDYNVSFINSVTNCESEIQTITLDNPGAPIIDPISPVINCGSSNPLPPITGTNVSASANYYTLPGGPQGGGSVVPIGTIYTAPTNITLYAYDANGACFDEESFSIISNELPTAQISGGGIYCPGDAIANIEITTTGSPNWTITYLFNGTTLTSNSVTSPISLGNVTGTYEILSISDGNCSNSLSGLQTAIVINPLPSVTSFYGGDSYCPTETPQDIFASVSGTGPWTINYTLNGNPQTIVGSTSPISLGNNVGTYILTELSDELCISTISEIETITINSIPTISLTENNPSVCNLSDGSILVSGTGSGTINWSGTTSGSISSATLNYAITSLGAGNYDVNFIDGTTGCQSATMTATLINPGAPLLINPGPQTVCDSYTLPAITGTTLSGNQAYYSNSQANGGTIILGPITSTQTIYIYDANGTCSDEESFVVTINNTPTITNPGPQSACESFSLPSISGLNLSGNEAYYTNTQANGGVVTSGPITSSQTVYIYDANGTCIDEESFIVSINPLPTATLSGESTYCQGDAVAEIIASISGTPNYTLIYTLNGTAQTQSGSTTSLSLGNTAGTYSLVSITDANCTNINLSSIQTILINTIPNAPTAGTDTVYCDNATPVSLLAQGTGSFTWYADQALTNLLGSNATLTPSMNVGATNYYVTETINGCESPPSLVVVSVEVCEIIVPTAFTPDNDQTNDIWVLDNIDQIYPKNVVSIYNRWGNIIYQSKQGQYELAPWDGTYNNEKMPVGSYYFIIEYNDNFTENNSGIVSILN